MASMALYKAACMLGKSAARVKAAFGAAYGMCKWFFGCFLCYLSEMKKNKP
jgi:hypothetical protein